MKSAIFPYIFIFIVCQFPYRANGNSLIFISANYFTDNISFDVTELVNNQISEGAINISIGNHTMGGDPEFGESKSFFANYIYQGKTYEISLNEGQTLSIPDQLNGDGGNGQNYNSRNSIWNDTDLFYVKSYTQVENNESQFRSYDFLAKSRDNFPAQNQSLSLPVDSRFSMIVNQQFSKEGSHYIFEDRFGDISAMLINYPNGLYEWNIGAGESSNRVLHSFSTNLDSFPSAVPKILGAKWENDTLLLNPSNPVIQIQPWANASSNGRIEYGFWSNSGSGGGSTSATTVNIDLSNFNLDKEHSAYLFYLETKIEQENENLQGDRYKARFGQVSALYFKIRFDSEQFVSGERLDLEILEASYGASGGSYDVSTNLQSKISNNQLSMLASSSQLGGDPAFGEVKTLIVKYRYGNDIRRVSVSEYEMLSIPNSAHELIQSNLSPEIHVPNVYNISYNQRLNVEGKLTKLVDIKYDLDCNRSVFVEFLFSFDGGQNYPIRCTAVNGDVGEGVGAGTNKKAIWDAAVDWDRNFTDRGRIMVKANYLD